MSATIRISLSLCLQRPTTRGSWTDEKEGAVSIVCGYLCEENTTEADFDAGALTRTLCRFGQQPACVCEVSIQGKS